MTDKKLKREFEYTLENPIGLHKSGERVFANKILITAPTMKQMQGRSIIKQAIMDSMQKMNERASQKDQKSSSKDKDLDINIAEQMMSVIYMNKDDEEIKKIINAFVDILKSSAEIEGERVVDSVVEQIDASDLDNMLGEYIANFILPSWMKRMVKD